MANNTKILQPDASRIMDGLRDTGYTIETAIADVVDNSIAANATVIKIDLNDVPCDSGHQLNLYIADNGCGMDMAGLENAMTYGSKKRCDAHSLGKFGLGLKTASTAFCKSLSLVSTIDGQNYYKVTWDLDHVADVNQWELLESSPSDDEIDYLEDVIAEGTSGTLVVWDKVDRLLNRAYVNYMQAYNNLVKKLSFHLSMVFQRFLDTSNPDAPNIEITFNGIKLQPWDPFCKSEIRYLEDNGPDPNGTVLAGNNAYELEDENGNSISAFTLKAWVLPRKEMFSSNEAYNNANIKNSMSGFFVYRENRLILYADWLGIITSDPHFSLLRIDLSFDSSFDDFFNVDIKKSKVRLNEDVAVYIEDFLKAPRKVAEQRYRKGQIDKSGGNSGAVHAPSNTSIDGIAPTLPGETPVVTPNQTTGEVQVSPTDGKPSFVTGTIKIVVNQDDSQCRVIPVPSIDSNMLWEPSVTPDGKHAVSINMGHPYYQKIYAQNVDNPNLIIGMDSLLWALSEAEMRICNDDTKETFEELRVEVSRFLKKLISSLPEE